MRVPRSIVAVLTLAVIATGAAACGGDDKQTSPTSGAAAPSGAVTPGVQIDGSYQVGTLPDPDAAAALKVAVDTLPLAVSFDYRSLDSSLTQATAAMTPKFAADFRRIFEATTRAKAIRERTIQSSLVRGAGVVDTVRDGRVTCLVYLNQVLVASKFKKPNSALTVLQNRVRVRMQKVDGAWKVDGIEPF